MLNILEYKKEITDLKTECLIPKTNSKKKFPTVVTYDQKIWLNNTCDTKNLKQQSVCSKMNKLKSNKNTCNNVEYVKSTVLNEYYKNNEKPMNPNVPSFPIKVFSMGMYNFSTSRVYICIILIEIWTCFFKSN